MNPIVSGESSLMWVLVGEVKLRTTEHLSEMSHDWPKSTVLEKKKKRNNTYLKKQFLKAKLSLSSFAPVTFS